MPTRVALLSILALALSCSGEPEPEPTPAPDVPEPGDTWAVGPYGVGVTTTTLEDTARDRTLTVEVWYPTLTTSEGAPTSHFEPEGERAALEALLDAAPYDCPTRTTRSTRDADPLVELGARPLIVFSHCLNCGRYSSFSLAERLASHGAVVVAPDHAGARPFLEESPGEALTPQQLRTRISDIGAVLDASLDGSLLAGAPAISSIELDPEAVGMMGHSFGSATTGFVAQNDPRIKAAVGLAAPMVNPLFRGARMEDITVPVMLVIAEEDNSVGELGNGIMRDNFEAANSPAWRVDLEDAGHWSTSDIAGLREPFMPGCGSGERHSQGNEGSSFDYIPPARGIDHTAKHVTTFLIARLTDHAQAAERLSALPEIPGVEVFSR